MGIVNSILNPSSENKRSRAEIEKDIATTVQSISDAGDDARDAEDNENIKLASKFKAEVKALRATLATLRAEYASVS